MMLKLDLLNSTAIFADVDNYTANLFSARRSPM